jgi:hypothetical protein
LLGGKEGSSLTRGDGIVDGVRDGSAEANKLGLGDGLFLGLSLGKNEGLLLGVTLGRRLREGTEELD